MLLKNINKNRFYILIALVIFLSKSGYGATIKNNANVWPDYKIEDIQKLPEVNGSIFYYFGFGSNLLTKRIHIQNPTAKKIGAAKLENFRLDFYGFTERWNGAPATIVPEKNATTYGTLWTIELTNLRNIDDQEGVFEQIYAPLSINVSLLNNGSFFPARAYYLVEQPTKSLSSFEGSDVPFELQPSKTYLQCLVKGAFETGLPTDYITWLQSIKHNGKIANDLEDLLELKDVKLST